MAEQKNGGNLTRSKPIIMTYAFPSITCRVTVPPQPNDEHNVACSGVDVLSDKSARVNWTYTDAENDPQTGFQIDVATRSDFATSSIVKSIVAPANTDISAIRNRVIMDLQANTQYYARIRAYNAMNAWSNYSTCSG